MTYTDTQLKQALAKMLPKTHTYTGGDIYHLGKSETPYNRVLDTELLHLCWLVEEMLTQKEREQYGFELAQIVKANLSVSSGDEWFMLAHATWQQRTIALAKVKGIEIV